MGLEGEAPARMGEDVVDHLGGVESGAGLEEEMACGEQVGDGLDVLTLIHYLELVDASYLPGGVLG